MNEINRDLKCNSFLCVKQNHLIDGYLWRNYNYYTTELWKANESKTIENIFSHDANTSSTKHTSLIEWIGKEQTRREKKTK